MGTFPQHHLQGIPGFLHHRAASFAGAPITARERRHVTQPRARFNVSCSRAGHKGAKGGGGKASEGQRRPAKASKGQRRPAKASEGQRRVVSRRGTEQGGTEKDSEGQGGTRTTQGRHSPEIAEEIAEEIAPLIHPENRYPAVE
jgi:hypothetical protein